MEREQIKTKRGKFLLWCAKVQRDHWLVSLLVVRLSGLWFSLIISFLGTPLKLITVNPNGGKSLTLLGWIISTVIFGIIILGEIALKYEGVAYNTRYYETGYNILSEMNIRLSNVCKEKKGTLLEIINNINVGRDQKFIRIVSDPINQLKVISNEITECLCRFLQENSGKKWRFRDIYVSIAYEFTNEDDGWRWATEEKGLSIDTLLSGKDRGDNNDDISTFRHLTSITQNNVFYNSKENARNEHHYIPDDLDEYDEDGKLLGSIACYEKYLKKSDTNYIHYVLSISSYSQHFTNDDSRESIVNIKHNMKGMIISDFMDRIDVELCLLYLEYLGKKKGR